jgi:hypothetical protein
MSKEKSALAALNDSFKEKLHAVIAGAAEGKNYEGLQAQIKEVVDSYLEELKGYIPKYQKPEE